MANQDKLYGWWWGPDGPNSSEVFTIGQIETKLQPAKSAGVATGKQRNGITASGWNYAVLKFLIEKCELADDFVNILKSYADPHNGNYGGWRHHLDEKASVITAVSKKKKILTESLIRSVITPIMNMTL